MFPMLPGRWIENRLLRVIVRSESEGKESEMAQQAEMLELEEDRLLRGYLRILVREAHTDPKLRSPGHDLRTCTECGERVAFALDPAGTWFRCTRCGAYA
jgi:hypothetical protein